MSHDAREQCSRAPQTVAKVPVRLAPRSLQRLQRPQLPTRLTDGCELCRGSQLRSPQQIDVLRHFLQHAQVPMRFGDQSSVERAKRRDVTLGFDKVAVGSFRAHTQTMPSSRRAWQLIGVSVVHPTQLCAGPPSFSQGPS